MTARYAFYFSPAAHTELAAFGSTCLGRTANEARKPDSTSTFPDQERWQSLTHKPAHYGFHATLKAPFELRSGVSVDQLKKAALAFAANETPISLAGLYPHQLSHFLALTLSEQIDSVSALAQRCVESFESFRLPISDADIQRRLQQPLSDRQKTLLRRFGYPYVDDQFRFHMTLSGKLTDQDKDYTNWTKKLYQHTVRKAPELDCIALFMQADRELPFIRLSDFPFQKSRE